MADNYLERRMEDYRSGRLAVKKPVRPARTRGGGDSGVMTLEFPPMNVLVSTPILSPLSEALVRMARTLGARVAVLSDDRAGGARVAQECGARFYPSLPLAEVLADLAARWGGVDVAFSPEGVDVGDARLIELRDLGGDPAAMARLYMFVAHPDNAFFTVS